MQLHELKIVHKSKKKRRVGRGGKRGTTSGRGTKGQKSRAGHRIRPAVRDIIMQMPKRRGANFISLKAKPVVFNLDFLSEKFADGETVSPKTLADKKILRFQKGRLPTVKILGRGEIKKKLHFENCLFSASAKKSVGAGGGTIREQS